MKDSHAFCRLEGVHEHCLEGISEKRMLVGENLSVVVLRDFSTGDTTVLSVVVVEVEENILHLREVLEAGILAGYSGRFEVAVPDLGVRVIRVRVFEAPVQLLAKFAQSLAAHDVAHPHAERALETELITLELPPSAGFAKVAYGRSCGNKLLNNRLEGSCVYVRVNVYLHIPVITIEVVMDGLPHVEDFGPGRVPIRGIKAHCERLKIGRNYLGLATDKESNVESDVFHPRFKYCGP